MNKRNIMIISVVVGLVLVGAGGVGAWYFLQQGQKVKMATSMLCTTFALQMSQIHKQRSLLLEAMEGLKKGDDKTKGAGDAKASEPAADAKEAGTSTNDESKFLFGEKVDSRIDEFVTSLESKYDANRGMNNQSPEVMTAFSDMAQFLAAEAAQYWGDCQAQMQPALEQCSAFQENEAELAECMKTHGGKIRDLMGKYLKMDLNS